MIKTGCDRTRIDLCLYAGKNVLTVQVLEGGDPMDCTGATVTAQARRASTEAAAAITAIVTAVDESQGIYTLRWPEDQIRAALAGERSWAGVWDLDVMEAGESESITPCFGSVEATLDVTR